QESLLAEVSRISPSPPVLLQTTLGRFVTASRLLSGERRTRRRGRAGFGTKYIVPWIAQVAWPLSRGDGDLSDNPLRCSMPDKERAGQMDWEDVRYFVALARYGMLPETARMRTDFTGQDYLRNPAPGLAKLRAAGPMLEGRFPILGKAWITTTHDLTDRVL